VSVVRQPTYGLHDRIMDGKLADFLREQRDAGESWDSIVITLREQHDLRVTSTTLRRWWAEIKAAS
jgi:hypothetical protein